MIGLFDPINPNVSGGGAPGKRFKYNRILLPGAIGGNGFSNDHQAGEMYASFLRLAYAMLCCVHLIKLNVINI